MEEKSPPRPGLMKTDWNLIDFESEYKISRAEKTQRECWAQWLRLWIASYSCHSIPLCPGPPIVSHCGAGSERDSWSPCFASNLCLRTPSDFVLSSSPVSRSKLSFPDGWHLMFLYRCWFKSFIQIFLVSISGSLPRYYSDAVAAIDYCNARTFVPVYPCCLHGKSSSSRSIISKTYSNPAWNCRIWYTIGMFVVNETCRIFNF